MNGFFSKIPEKVEHSSSFQRREMKIENIINRFRFGFLLVLLVADILSYYLNQHPSFFAWEEHKSFFILLAASPVLILIHILSSKKNYYPWLKYIAVGLDMTVIFVLGIGLIHKTQTFFTTTNTELALLVTVVFIFFSFLSVLRLSNSVILLSAILAIIYNLVVYLFIDKLLVLGIFMTLIIGMLYIFIFWVNNYILQYLLLSNKINSAYNEIKDANTQISQQNEEISTQKEEINNHLLNLEQAYSELSDSIMYAKKIQNALINNAEILKEQLKDYFVFFKPKSIVSGDFFWTSETDNKIIFVLADCTGHGVPGAFMTMLGTSLLNEIVNKRKNTEPATILNILRDEIIRALHQDGKLYQPKDGMDMLVLRIDQQNQEILFSGANNSFVYVPNTKNDEKSSIIEWKGDRMPVSYHYKMHDFSQLKLSYKEGDKIYMYTDGYIDQFGGPKGKKFKSVPFKRMLYNNHAKPMINQQKELETTLKNWLKHKYEQIDDITVVGMEL